MGKAETGLTTRAAAGLAPMQKREEERLGPWVGEQRKEHTGRKAVARLALRHVVQRGVVKELGDQLGLMDTRELAAFDDAAVARRFYERALDDQQGRSENGVAAQQYTLRAFVSADMEDEPVDVILFWIGIQPRQQQSRTGVDTTPANEAGLTSALMRHNERYADLICEQVRGYHDLLEDLRSVAGDLAGEVKALRQQSRLDDAEMRATRSDKFSRKQARKELKAKLEVTNEAVSALKLIVPPIAKGLFKWAGMNVDIPPAGDPSRAHLIALAQSLDREQFTGVVKLMKSEAQLASWLAFWEEVNKLEAEEQAARAKAGKGKNGKGEAAAAAPADAPVPATDAPAEP